MSRKRRAVKTRRVSALTLAKFDVLLTGQTRSPQEVDALESQGIEYGDPFEEFVMTTAQRDALIEAHRPELQAEAQRRGLMPPWMTGGGKEEDAA